MGDTRGTRAPPGQAQAPRRAPDSRRRLPEDTREFARGAGAAFVNILVTFPAHKVMFRQQLHGVSARRAARGMYAEGAAFLYRGVVPPLIQRSAAMALMFGLYDRYLTEMRKRWAPASAAGVVAQQALAAVAAGSTEALMAPLERVQTLLQAPQYNRTLHGTWDAFVKLRGHGVREYYRGFTGLLLRNGPSNALFFTLRRPLKDALPPARSRLGDASNDFISGALLGASISTALYPVNVVKTHMQGRIGGRFESPLKALFHVYEARGRRPARLFRGVHINFSRSCLSWGIINSTYEALGKIL